VHRQSLPYAVDALSASTRGLMQSFSPATTRVVAHAAGSWPDAADLRPAGQAGVHHVTRRAKASYPHSRLVLLPRSATSRRWSTRRWWSGWSVTTLTGRRHVRRGGDHCGVGSGRVHRRAGSPARPSRRAEGTSPDGGGARRWAHQPQLPGHDRRRRRLRRPGLEQRVQPAGHRPGRRAAQHAGRLGGRSGAPVIEALPEENVLVVGFLPAAPWSPRRPQPGPDARIATAVRTLHAGPAFEGHFDMRQIRRRYLGSSSSAASGCRRGSST